MTAQELSEIVDQRMADPTVLGRIACNLCVSDPLLQRHHDGKQYLVWWHDHGDFWRCTILPSDDPTHRLAQIDIHDNGTVRADVYEACRVTVAHEEGFLCLTRYKSE